MRVIRGTGRARFVGGRPSDTRMASATTTLPTRAASVPEGRAFLSKALAAWGCHDKAHDARLLVSELRPTGEGKTTWFTLRL